MDGKRARAYIGRRAKRGALAGPRLRARERALRFVLGHASETILARVASRVGTRFSVLGDGDAEHARLGEY